jgi:hypothetical protein
MYVGDTKEWLTLCQLWIPSQQKTQKKLCLLTAMNAYADLEKRFAFSSWWA